jgi:hypothetical protein
VRLALRRAPVQTMVRVLYGTRVLAETSSLGGRRNVEWAQEQVTKHTTSEPGPGLYTIEVGDVDVTWDTTWRDEEPTTPARQESRVLDHYETLASRSQAAMFEMLRQLRQDHDDNRKRDRELLVAIRERDTERDKATALLLDQVTTIQSKNTKAVGKLMAQLGDAIARRENEPEAVAVARVQAEQEADRVDAALEIVDKWMGTHALLAKAKAAKASEAAPTSTDVAKVPDGPTPKDVATDILAKLPDADRKTILAHSVGATLTDATTMSELTAKLRTLVTAAEAGELDISDVVVAAAKRMLADFDG